MHLALECPTGKGINEATDVFVKANTAHHIVTLHMFVCADNAGQGACYHSKTTNIVNRVSKWITNQAYKDTNALPIDRFTFSWQHECLMGDHHATNLSAQFGVLRRWPHFPSWRNAGTSRFSKPPIILKNTNNLIIQL